jgi:hypothetical protein
MAFTTINPSEIDVGDPLKKDLFDKIKNSLDDLNARQLATESGISRVDVFDGPVLIGAFAVTATGILHAVASRAFTLTECRIRIFEKNGISSGTLEVDVKKNTTFNDTGMSSVFTTRPSINFATAADYDFSTNQVFDGTKIDIDPDDVLRIDITSLPTGLGKFYLQFYGEVS